MDFTCRLEDWLSLRPVVVHVISGEVPQIGRDATIRQPGNHYVWLLRRGSVEVENDGKLIVAHAGDWVVAHPGPRRQKFSEDAQILSIQFQACWPDGLHLFENGLSLKFPAARYPKLEHYGRALFEQTREFLPNDSHASRKAMLHLHHYLLFEELGLAFLRCLFSAMMEEGLIPARVGPIDDRLMVALRQLDAWPLDLAFDPARLTRLTGVSARHLAHLFEVTFETTPARYLHHRRLTYARRMLGHSSVAIKVIACELGFSSQADFSSWFKRHSELSPRVYRRSTMNFAHL